MVNLHLQCLVGNGVGSIGGNGALRDFRAFLRRGSRAAIGGYLWQVASGVEVDKAARPLCEGRLPGPGTLTQVLLADKS